MHALLPFTTDLIQAFGWTILHSFWQGCCVFLCLRIVLWLWPQAGPSIKYHLSFLSLTGIAGWFGATFATQLKSFSEAAEPVMMAMGGGIAPMPMPLAFATTPSPGEGLKAAFPGMEAYFPLLVGIYVVGVTVMTIRLCIDLAQLKTLRRQGLSSLGKVWEDHLVALARKMGIGKRVGLHISRHLQVPVMVGFIRPVILLPAAMVNNLSPEQLEAILLHELAHIKRNDYLLNIFQSIVETLLFFNPFIWWISRNIRQEREHCCDDLVLANTVQPMHYAKALVALEELRLTVNPMAMAAAHDRHQLFHRIKRIMEMKTKHLNYSQRLLALMIIITGLVSIAWLTPESKHGKKERKAAVTASQNKHLPAAEAACVDTVTPDFITEPEIPVPPMPPSAPLPPSAAAVPCPPPAPGAPVTYAFAGNIPSIPPIPPMPPMPKMPSMPHMPSMPQMPPMPPMPQIPPVPAGAFNMVFDQSTGAVWYNSPGDTVVPGGRILIRDKNGKERTFNSIDDMSAEDRKAFEESYIKMQKSYNFNYNFKHDFKLDSINFNLRELDVSKMQLMALRELEKMDVGKIRAQIDEVMSKKWEDLDENIRKDIRMDKATWEKAMWDARKEIEKIDWKARQEDIRRSIQDIKKEEIKFRKEVEKSRKDGVRQKVDSEYVRNDARFHAEATASNRKAREKAIHEHERAMREQETAMRRHDQAFKAGEQQKSSTRKYNDFLKALEADKLIDRNNGFDIQKKGDDLIINGKKQSGDVKKKYEQYLENDNVTIRGNKSNLQIHAQDNN